MNKKITTPYFPQGLKFFAPPFALAGLYLCFTGHPIFGAGMLIVGIVVLTTNYVTEIDLTAKHYRDYLSISGIKLNEEVSSFNGVDRITITKGNHTQRVVSRVQSRQIDWSDYTATLLFDDGKGLDVLTRNDKRQLILEIKPLAEFLHTGVEDQTTRDPYFIDISQVGKE